MRLVSFETMSRRDSLERHHNAFMVREWLVRRKVVHAAAVIAPALLTGAILAFSPVWPSPYPFQYLAVIAAAGFLGGFAAGAVATAGSGVALWYLHQELDSGLVTFVGLGLFLSYLGGRRFRTEAARARNQAQLTATLEAVQDGVAIFNTDGQLLFANEAEARLNKYPNAQSMQQDIAHFATIYELRTLAGEILPVDQWPVARVLRGESLSQWELRARRRDVGHEWVFSFSGAPVRDADGEQVLAVIVSRDVTERVHAEIALRASAAREKEANSVKDAFLAILSHELRTPLNVILGYSGILKGQPQDSEHRQRATTVIHRNVEVLVRIVEDLLDVQRIVAGRLQIEYEWFDLQQTARVACESLQPMAAAKRLDLVAQLEPVRIEADEARIYQVLWNLLSNAIKFTPEGGTVRLRVGHGDADTATVTVEDTGQGIPAHFLPHVFERFRQLDMSATRRHFGMGVGLAVVKHVAQEHGGSVAVASGGDGQGSVFTVTLPLRRPALRRLDATG